MCKTCGHSQAAHRESLKRPGQLKGAALKVKNSVTSMNNSPSSSKTKTKRPCKNFKIDLHHPTGFATCLNCGHTQAAHKVKCVNANLQKCDEDVDKKRTDVRTRAASEKGEACMCIIA